ncbi:hypothetical protein WBK31_20560 [Nonomuraea sp. N2-4H]|uniref:hypothetical protein n=1 Tax=Nonomuraea sp. N2-4H TaxID=3128898 RepID=UPI003250CCF9
MFSTCSRLAPAATGSRYGSGATRPVPQTSTAVTGDSSVRPLYSVTVPVIRTRSPTLTSLTDSRAYANSPSDVAGSASGRGSCRKKPLSWSVRWKSAVTTPSTRTVCPARGLASPAP